MKRKGDTMTKAGWNFDNSYTRLPTFFFSKQMPNTVKAPELVVFNHSLARQLGLNEDDLQNEKGTSSETPDITVFSSLVPIIACSYM